MMFQSLKLRDLLINSKQINQHSVTKNNLTYETMKTTIHNNTIMINSELFPRKIEHVHSFKIRVFLSHYCHSKTV